MSYPRARGRLRVRRFGRAKLSAAHKSVTLTRVPPGSIFSKARFIQRSTAMEARLGPIPTLQQGLRLRMRGRARGKSCSPGVFLRLGQHSIH